MRFIIKHDIKGRMRVHLSRKRLGFTEADTLQYYLQGFSCVDDAKVYERTADAAIRYSCDRKEIIRILREFRFEEVTLPAGFPETSGRELNAKYYDRLVTAVVLHYGKRLIVPMPLRILWVGIKTVRYIWRGLKTIPEKKLKVEMLDAAAITASVLMGDYRTASSVMFLLKIGDMLEEWTHKKSVDDLARRMSLNISKVWLVSGGSEVQVDADTVKPGDRVIVRMGNIIPFDGKVVYGDAMVNQASMTGEAIPVRKDKGKTVFAGTAVEEGEITIEVTHTSGSGRFDKIVRMIEESEKLKSSVESKAENLADKLVPYTLLGAGLTYLFTRNITKAVSVLMVDYSCALKLSMPLSVLSAIREAGNCNITVKGGKFMEAVSEADTIVFDKTGTLTKAEPVVADVVSFCREKPDELLREAACLEEHFPHSIANAVVNAAMEKGLSHDEFHTKVNYIVAHGISTTINGKKAVIGSYHFIFEDEGVKLPKNKQKLFDSLPDEYSHLYYAKEGKLAAVILIEDPLREEAYEVIKSLKEHGIGNVVMMTGDSERTAKAIASRVGVDRYYSEVLPEDKAGYIEKVKQSGAKVIMTGDGINDSPALSAADAGIAINEGADIARQIADITIGSENLHSIVILKELSDLLMKRIKFNYRSIVAFNTGLIFLGVAGVLPPAASALLHNASTIALGLNAMTPLLGENR